MPRKKTIYAEKAKRAFLRGTVHDDPDVAIRCKARPEEEWLARMEGFRNRHYCPNGRKARRAVERRHPMEAQVHDGPN